MFKNEIKAIETEYQGYRFRSRLEARWAVFLDSCKEEWQYEPEGYKLESGYYLPDFWLPRLDCWLEIKGKFPSKCEQTRIEDLGLTLDKPAIIAWGLPTNRPCYTWFQKNSEGIQIFCGDITSSSTGSGFHDSVVWAFDEKKRLCICTYDSFPREWVSPCLGKTWNAIRLPCQINAVVDDYNINKAKAARFEFGQQYANKIELKKNQTWDNTDPNADWL